MKTSITIEEIKSIYALHGAGISPSDLIESMEQCNEQADVVYSDIWGETNKTSNRFPVGELLRFAGSRRTRS